jgi:uncharacterized protein YbdZ (MbtH family)
MSRIKKLKNHYQKQLTEKNIKDIPVFIQFILNADITKGKYARFLIESFLNNKFLEEDLVGGLESTIGQAISLFDKHKGKLPIEQRSVYALDEKTGEALYQSPGNLWNSVKQFQGELSGKELKKEEQEKIYRETEFIYKDEETGFQIVSPLTEESAKWWGKGTRWCTSAKNNNQFENYAKDAPLLILLLPNDDKLQLWKYKDDIQFMDEADNKVSLEYIEQHWTILKPICLWLNNLQYIPEALKTPEICELAVKNNGRALHYVPKDLITKELCEMAVNQEGCALQYVPKELKTDEICELAVKNNGYALRCIPKELKNNQICRIAVKNDVYALYDVPEEYKTLDTCQLAVENNGSALKYVPEKFKTIEMCELAVKQNGLALSYTPLKLRTKELCEMAVQQNGEALVYVPDEYITKELCEVAVKKNGVALQFVSEELRTKELCKLAVKQNGYALEYVPEKYKTPEMCELAVKNNGFALKYVPEKFKTIEMCELAVKNNGSALKYVPEKLGKLSINYKEKYKKTFQEIKGCFPKKTLSLDIK